MLTFQKVITSVIFIVLTATNFPVFASDIVGGQAPVLEKNMMDAASIYTMKKRCDEAGIMTVPNRSTCDEVVNNVKLTQSAYDTCVAKKERFAFFLECLRKSDGRDYPTSYQEACAKARANKSSNIRVCQEYLAQTQSSFDSEAFKFCIQANNYGFDNAKPCLNAIRDRQVDAQNLKRTCIDERSMAERLDDCVARVTDKAPSLVACASGTSRQTGGATTNAGKR